MASTLPEIRGDYQHQALHCGPHSQRQWHRQKLEVTLGAVARATFYRALDAGCGSGIISVALARAYPNSEVVGMDASDAAIAFCREAYRQPNLAFETADLTRPLRLNERQFDLIVSTEVIEHLDQSDISLYLANLYALGTPHCRYFLSTPNYDSAWPLVERTLDLLRLTPRMRGHQHLTFLNPERLSQFLHAAGFRIERVYGFCGFGPLLKSLSPGIATRLERWETGRRRGMLIGCEFAKANLHPRHD